MVRDSVRRLDKIRSRERELFRLGRELVLVPHGRSARDDIHREIRQAPSLLTAFFGGGSVQGWLARSTRVVADARQLIQCWSGTKSRTERLMCEIEEALSVEERDAQEARSRGLPALAAWHLGNQGPLAGWRKEIDLAELTRRGSPPDDSSRLELERLAQRVARIERAFEEFGEVRQALARGMAALRRAEAQMDACVQSGLLDRFPAGRTDRAREMLKAAQGALASARVRQVGPFASRALSQLDDLARDWDSTLQRAHDLAARAELELGRSRLGDLPETTRLEDAGKGLLLKLACGFTGARASEVAEELDYIHALVGIHRQRRLDAHVAVNAMADLHAARLGYESSDRMAQPSSECRKRPLGGFAPAFAEAIRGLRGQARNRPDAELGAASDCSSRAPSESSSQWDSDPRGGRARHGLAWTAGEDHLLDDLVKTGTPLDEVARQLGRSTGAVRSRIHKRAERSS